MLFFSFYLFLGGSIVILEGLQGKGERCIVQTHATLHRHPCFRNEFTKKNAAPIWSSYLYYAWRRKCFWGEKDSAESSFLPFFMCHQAAPSLSSDIAPFRRCPICLRCWSLDHPSSIMLKNGMSTLKVVKNTLNFSHFAVGVKGYCAYMHPIIQVPSVRAPSCGVGSHCKRTDRVQMVLFSTINHGIRPHPSRAIFLLDLRKDSKLMLHFA